MNHYNTRLKDRLQTALEVCAASPAGARAAAIGGARRIELCSALGEGGVTPSIGLMETARAAGPDVMNVLIRPRGGDFVYDTDEIDCMLRDIAAASQCGADGVVIGALSPDGRIDAETCRTLIEAAGDMSVTFHRAFDLCRDPFEALDTIIELGCNRLLTSGCKSTAQKGARLIAELNREAAGRIIIMPGGGINASNAAEIMQTTGCRELHASARATLDSPMTWRRQGIAMGTPGADEYSRLETSPGTVSDIVKAMSEAYME